ncbi:hypothetical protein [Streptomyces sp. NPDC048521]|uniref:hypothetical protein n=1 Tax=Streptomyces sp. NPDC048521 TaxID=3365566 RepID=UPI0037143E2C
MSDETPARDHSAHGHGGQEGAENWTSAAKVLQDAAPLSTAGGAVRTQPEGEPERAVEAGGTLWRPARDMAPRSTT